MSDMDEVIAQIEGHIATIGWGVIGVGPTVHDEPFPPFAYTAGLWRSYHSPELIMVGLNHTTMHTILNDAGRLVRDGKILQVGERLAGLLVDATYTLGVGGVADVAKREHFAMAYNVYRTWEFPAFQLLWPDTVNRLPTEDGYDAGQYNQPVYA